MRPLPGRVLARSRQRPGLSCRPRSTFGLTAAAIAQEFPRLIGVNIVGYGQGTSYAAMRAYDLLVQAESGLCAVTGATDTPSKVGVSVADIATGMNAYAAILEALLLRERTGRGQVIEIAMFDGMADWMTVPLLYYEHAGRETGRHGLAHASSTLIGPIRAATVRPLSSRFSTMANG